jgi:hypothetical protein
MERKKLELQINSPVNLQLLFDEPLVGESKFGEYYMYAVKNGEQEYSFFAPLSVHEQLKNKPKGTRFQITKTATQKGKKLVTDFEVKFLDNGIKKEKDSETKQDENGYYSAMLQSYADASRIQQHYSAVNLNQCAVSIFIARINKNGFNNYPKE